MSYLDTSAYGDVPDLKVLEDGAEILLRIVSVEEKVSKAGNPQLVVRFEDPSDPLVDDIYCYLNLPDPDKKNSEPKKFIKSVRFMNEFFDCFSIDHSTGVDYEAIIGNEGYCIVSQEEYQGRISNKVAKFSKRR